MWPIAILIILVTPVGALAQYVGDLSPHPYSSNGIGNPFSSGGPYSLNLPAIPGRGPAAPISPYAWSNVSPERPAPGVFNRAELFDSSASPPVPTVPNPGRGPYGITLPGNHPLAIGEDEAAKYQRARNSWSMIVPAEDSQFDAAWTIIDRCRTALREQGILRWDDVYPSAPRPLPSLRWI
jgi:hypothetical protein